MTAAQAWKLGALWYRDRLDPDWRPKSVDAMTAIFDEVGLTSPFWSLT